MSISSQSLSIPTPNYCQIPLILLDEWMQRLGNAEFKILMFICRKTFGWHKLQDRISLRQIQEATGFTRSNITRAIKGLCDLGLVWKTKIGKNGEENSYYEVVIQENSNNSYQSCKKTAPSPVKRPTKETTTKEIEKEKDEKEKALRGVKTPAPPALFFSRKRVKMEDHRYHRLVQEFGETKIDEMIERLDEYADINPKRFRQYACHAAVIRKWIREDALKPKSKAAIEALELAKREEQSKILREQEKARKILQEKHAREQQNIFLEKVKKNFPIMEKYVERYSSVLRIYSKLNGLYEIKDSSCQYHICSFVEDDFEKRLQEQLQNSGIGLDYTKWPFNYQVCP